MLVARHRDETEGPMRKFLAKHAATTAGTLACLDRLLFKGHLPLGYPHAMEVHLTLRKVLLKDWKPYVLQQAERLKAPRRGAECVGRSAAGGQPAQRRHSRSPCRDTDAARCARARAPRGHRAERRCFPLSG